MYTQHNIYKRNDEKNTENSSSKGDFANSHTHSTHSHAIFSVEGWKSVGGESERDTFD